MLYFLKLDPEDCLRNISNVGVASVHDTSAKSKGTHIEETPRFKKYFKTTYNPRNLSFTLKQVTKTSKGKIVRYMSRNPGIFNYIPKFPPFPSAIFALAANPIGPEWSKPVFDKNVLSNKIEKQRSIPSSYSLSNFHVFIHGETKVTGYVPHGECLRLILSILYVLMYSFWLIIFMIILAMTEKINVLPKAMEGSFFTLFPFYIYFWISSFFNSHSLKEQPWQGKHLSLLILNT